MIDITVDNNEVTIETAKYHSFNNKKELLQLVTAILDKAKYSGESIRLSVIERGGKFFVQDW